MRSVRAPAAVLVLVLLAGCGVDPLVATPHGLTVTPLESRPGGPEIVIPEKAGEGRWTGTVRKQWTESRGGGPPKTGRAVLRLEVLRAREHGVLASRISIDVAEAEGLGETFLRKFDGLAFTLRHDDRDRPEPATIRFEAKASAASKTFLSGLWLAGLAGVAPWIPRRTVRVGEAWSRRDLGVEAALSAAAGIARAKPRLLGGGRAEILGNAKGARTLSVKLDTLVDVESSTRSEALSFGILDRGALTMDVRQGLPLLWSLEERTRLNELRGTGERTVEVVLHVDGELHRDE